MARDAPLRDEPTLLNKVDRAQTGPLFRVFLFSTIGYEEDMASIHPKFLLWGKGKKSAYPPKTLSQIFEQNARKHPHKNAIYYSNKFFTYQEINEKANQLAHFLLQQALKPGDTVGLLMSRSVDFVIGMLAIFKIRAIFVPIDPEYPEDRKQHMLQDTKARYVIQTLPPVSKYKKTNPKVAGKAEDTAIILYTSGSTGTPKGIILTHKGLLSHIYAEMRLHMSSSSKVLHTSGVSFDAAQLEIWTALLFGACLYINAGKLLSIDTLAKLISTQKITHVILTPSIYNLLLEYHISSLKHVRCLCSGGEAMSVTYVKKALKHMPRCVHLNMYGPAENSNFTTVFQVHRSTPLQNGVPIGKPIANTTVYILDEFLKPVAEGEIGELYTGGEGLALGYLNLPELTKERFIADPFRKNQKIYKTGDLARFLPDGNIEFCGRKDNQVKIAGNRIELDGIETVINALPHVHQSVVVMKTQHGVSYLAAYVERQKNALLTEKDVRKHLEKKFPESCLPRFIVIVDTLPITPNGKVDKQNLPSPYERQKENAVFASQKEQEMAFLWESLLGVPNIQSHDDFFLLGGSSILAAKLSAELSSQYGKEIPVHFIFEHSVLEDFVRKISQNRRTEELSSADLFWVWRAKECHIPLLLEPFLKPKKEQYLQPKAILLTGATGFFGAFILQELLQSTTALVYCLARSSTTQSAQKRLFANLEKYRISFDPKRIIVIEGHLGEALCGLKPQEFDRLGEIIDSIFHAGAQVNHLLPYSQLKASNVNGTFALFRLSMHKKAKPLHFVSTLDVFDMRYERVLKEDEDMEKEKYLQTGYGQSKWVAEQMMRKGGRGFVSIYRMGRINGSSETGACNEEDFFWKMVQASFAIQAFPNLSFEEGFAAVNACAKILCSLAKDPEKIGKTYHIANPVHQTYLDLFQKIQKTLQTSFPIIPYSQWLKKLKTSPSDVLQRSFALFSSFAMEKAKPIQTVFRKPLEFPAMDVKKIIEYLNTRGFL